MLNGWRARSWGVFRLFFGGYLVVHFLALLPWAAEVFSTAGMNTAQHSPLFPILPSLLWISNGPLMTTGLVALGALGAFALALGWRDRWAAGLSLWVLASLFAANPLIANPSLPHIGWLLLAHASIPSAPALWTLLRTPKAGEDWRLPPSIFAAGWAVMALSYGYSGWTKLAAASWIDGTALTHVLNNPLARPGELRVWLLGRPGLLILGTTAALALELGSPLIALFRRLRPWLWIALLALQLGVLVLVDFADLTVGMLVLQAWTFDPAWLVRTEAPATGTAERPSASFDRSSRPRAVVQHLPLQA